MRKILIAAAAAAAALCAGAPAQAGLPQVSTVTVLNSSQSTVIYGQAFTLTATVVGLGGQVNTGTVGFLADGNYIAGGQAVAVNGAGQAVFTVSTLPGAPDPFKGLGQFLLTADYNDNATFGASDSQGVLETVESLTQTTLSASTDNVALGGQLTLTAKVVTTSLPGVAMGAVSFYDGATLLGAQTLDTSGLASLTLDADLLALGGNSLTAVYGAQTVYLASTSAADRVTLSVPEPTTWALMTAGLGLAGGLLRRRRGALAG